MELQIIDIGSIPQPSCSAVLSHEKKKENGQLALIIAKLSINAAKSPLKNKEVKFFSVSN